MRFQNVLKEFEEQELAGAQYIIRVQILDANGRPAFGGEKPEKTEISAYVFDKPMRDKFAQIKEILNPSKGKQNF